GRGDVERGFGMGQSVAAAKGEDAAMFEEASDDRARANVVGQSGHTWPQAANAAYDEIDLHARLACVVQRIDDDRVDQRIAVQPDWRRAARLGVIDFLRDVMEDAPLQRYR